MCKKQRKAFECDENISAKKGSGDRALNEWMNEWMSQKDVLFLLCNKSQKNKIK